MRQPRSIATRSDQWLVIALSAFVIVGTLVSAVRRFVELVPNQDVPVEDIPEDASTQPAADDVPDAAEIAARRDAVWAPYHAQLRAELDRIRARHGVAVLWDAHSIRSVLPRFFEGKLPDLNLGTADGASCDAALAHELLSIAKAAEGYTAVLNGRFKGGHITRHYGQPAHNIHAVQLEMTQCSYMQEALPFDYLPEVAAGRLRVTVVGAEQRAGYNRVLLGEYAVGRAEEDDLTMVDPAVWVEPVTSFLTPGPVWAARRPAAS